MTMQPGGAPPVDAVTASTEEFAATPRTTERLTAAGGVLGAIAASFCCVLPLAFASLGVTGAWIGNLTALAPYQPYVLALTAACLGYGFYLVYWRPRYACTSDAACSRPLPNRIVKTMLWLAVVLLGINLALSYGATFLLDS